MTRLRYSAFLTICVALAVAICFTSCRKRRTGRTPPPVAATDESAATEEPAAAPSPGMNETRAPEPCLSRLVFPTDQTNWFDTNATSVFQMPTATSEIESAKYGSARTAHRGRYTTSAFHEGVDIAATKRDSRGNAEDRIYAAADGTIGHISRVAGNSSYGRYVVLLHPVTPDRAYTLYAHLASIPPNLRMGERVSAGTVIGIMGNSSSRISIPLANSHLHFEIGLVLNNRFDAWFRAQQLRPEHGLYNGWNLCGVDPIAVYRIQRDVGTVNVKSIVQRLPAAFEMVFRAERIPDYFRRYPWLWDGSPPDCGAVTVACSEGGVPIRGRAARPAEKAAIGSQPCAIQNVVAEALGRNGRHMIICRDGQWHLAKSGKQWLEILTY